MQTHKWGLFNFQHPKEKKGKNHENSRKSHFDKSLLTPPHKKLAYTALFSHTMTLKWLENFAATSWDEQLASKLKLLHSP